MNKITLSGAELQKPEAVKILRNPKLTHNQALALLAARRTRGDLIHTVTPGEQPDMPSSSAEEVDLAA